MHTRYAPQVLSNTRILQISWKLKKWKRNNAVKIPTAHAHVQTMHSLRYCTIFIQKKYWYFFLISQWKYMLLVLIRSAAVTLTLVLQTLVLHLTHCVMMFNISAKSFQHPWRNKKAMDRRKCAHTYIHTYTYTDTHTLYALPPKSRSRQGHKKEEKKKVEKMIYWKKKNNNKNTSTSSDHVQSINQSNTQAWFAQMKTVNKQRLFCTFT